MSLDSRTPQHNRSYFEQNGEGFPWPDSETGSRSCGKAIVLTCFASAFAVHAALNQFYATSQVDNSGTIAISCAIFAGMTFGLVAWFGVALKQKWPFVYLRYLCWSSLIGTVLGVIAFIIWGFTLTPPFSLLNPVYAYNWPPLTIFDFVVALGCSIPAVIIGRRNDWFYAVPKYKAWI